MRLPCLNPASGHSSRTYLVSFYGTGKPLTPEGVSGNLATPKGKFVLVSGADGSELFPLEGGAPSTARARLASGRQG